MMASISMMDCENCIHKNVCKYFGGKGSVYESLKITMNLIEAKPFSFHVVCPDFTKKKEVMKNE